MYKYIWLIISLCLGYATLGDVPASAKYNGNAHTHAAVNKPKPVSQSQRRLPKKLATDGSINGHEYVDLGLPSGLKWATCNVGASSPSDFGDYFAWGEIAPKASYNESNCLTAQKNNLQLESEGIINSSGILTSPYDAAHTNWGATWRIPTKEEFEELIDKCNWTRSTDNGKTGYKITGHNGKTIFLPAGDVYRGTTLNSVGEFGCYWSASVVYYIDAAYDMLFDTESSVVCPCYRYDGLSVRPVSE